MATRFVRMYHVICHVHAHPDIDLGLDTSPEFLASVRHVIRLLRPIQYVTQMMQEQNMSLSRCRSLCWALRNEVFPMLAREENFHIDSTRLTTNHEMNPLIRREYNTDFQNAIVKLQREQPDDLTPNEARTVEKLEIPEDQRTIPQQNSRRVRARRALNRDNALVIGDDEDEDDEHTMNMRFLEDIYNMPERQAGRNYHDCSFVTGSDAEIERLFLGTSNIQTQNRASLNRNTFDAIMFLRENKSLWNIEDVANAVLNRVDNELLGEFRQLNVEEPDDSFLNNLEEDGEHHGDESETRA